MNSCWLSSTRESVSRSAVRPSQAFRVLANDIQELQIVDGVMDRSVQERFRIALDGGEGRAQLVRDVDDEILADVLQFLELDVFGFQAVEHELEFFTGFVELGREQSEHASGGTGRRARKLPSANCCVNSMMVPIRPET